MTSFTVRMVYAAVITVTLMMSLGYAGSEPISQGVLPATPLVSLITPTDGLQTTGSEPAKVGGGSLTGTVTDLDGKPIPGAQVSAFHWATQSSGDFAGKTTTDVNGRYRLTDLPTSGKYSVNAVAHGYGEVNSKHDLDLKNQTTVLEVARITLPRADSFIGGTVVDAQDKPVAGATITCHSPEVTLTTDPQGRFRIDGVVPGFVLLWVTHPCIDNGTAKFAWPMAGRQDNVVPLLTDAEAKESALRFHERMSAGNNHGDGTDAKTLLKAALANATQSGRGVFLMFHASWCGPCFLLHRFLERPEVKPIIDKYFVVQSIDIWEDRAHEKWNNPGGEALLAKYGKPDGIPFWVVLKANGQQSGTSAPPEGKSMGYPSSPENIAYFLKLIKVAAPSISEGERQILKQQLAKGLTTSLP